MIPGRYMDPDSYDAWLESLHRGTVLDERAEDDDERSDEAADAARDERAEVDHG